MSFSLQFNYILVMTRSIKEKRGAGSPHCGYAEIYTAIVRQWCFLTLHIHGRKGRNRCVKKMHSWQTILICLAIVYLPKLPIRSQFYETGIRRKQKSISIPFRFVLFFFYSSAVFCLECHPLFFSFQIIL